MSTVSRLHTVSSFAPSGIEERTFQRPMTRGSVSLEGLVKEVPMILGFSDVIEVPEGAGEDLSKPEGRLQRSLRLHLKDAAYGTERSLSFEGKFLEHPVQGRFVHPADGGPLLEITDAEPGPRLRDWLEQLAKRVDVTRVHLRTPGRGPEWDALGFHRVGRNHRVFTPDPRVHVQEALCVLGLAKLDTLRLSVRRTRQGAFLVGPGFRARVPSDLPALRAWSRTPSVEGLAQLLGKTPPRLAQVQRIVADALTQATGRTVQVSGNGFRARGAAPRWDARLVPLPPGTLELRLGGAGVTPQVLDACEHACARLGIRTMRHRTPGAPGSRPVDVRRRVDLPLLRWLERCQQGLTAAGLRATAVRHDSGVQLVGAGWTGTMTLNARGRAADFQDLRPTPDQEKALEALALSERFAHFELSIDSKKRMKALDALPPERTFTRFVDGQPVGTLSLHGHSSPAQQAAIVSGVERWDSLRPVHNFEQIRIYLAPFLGARKAAGRLVRTMGLGGFPDGKLLLSSQGGDRTAEFVGHELFHDLDHHKQLTPPPRPEPASFPLGKGVRRALLALGYEPQTFIKEDGAFRIGELVGTLPDLIQDPASVLYPGRAAKGGSAAQVRARKLKYLLAKGFELHLPVRNPGNAVLAAQLGSHRGEAQALPSRTND